MKIGQQLSVVVYACAALTMITLLITVELFYKQTQVQHRLDAIVSLHSQIDAVRGRLWLYQQYHSAETRQDAYHANQTLLQRLREKNSELPLQSIQVIRQAAQSIDTLLVLSARRHSEINTTDTSRLMVFSRYNMLLQTMSEAAFSMRQEAMHSAGQQQKALLLLHGGVLILLALLVTALATNTRRRFFQRLEELHDDVAKIKQGDLTTQLSLETSDEMSDLAAHVNEMKRTLKNTMVRKEQLAEEIAQQTQQLREQQQQLMYLAEHDELTRLFNRRAFESHVEVALMRASRAQTKAALLFIDVNRFKEVNDTYGHGVGDELLKVVSQRLKLAVRRSDLVGRLGGDEFIVWLDLLADKQALHEVIERIMQEMRAPMVTNGAELELSLSIGVSCFPTDGLELQQLMNQADAAMYHAKANPSAGCCFYSNLNTREIE
ncbi:MULTISPECIES: diguanylate cyclase domain-containing protein [unclassified Salinivibrio]|uniref:diguanylate cyclase domain-containing protein n=1 Tax=unclassified Salinivibrio TaxID=2636825 RepID=UPI0009872C11|nr:MULTISPECIES: diguanylate cyclase [unclassified Salinivibrio]OOF12557.1 hypothetical protein BZG82_01130 [Salinivibrio sp. PR5]OOF16462.1 hypothetical protein BZG83_00520 [Salinivibrio sp. PR919]OOF18559.1 hypothetical protein BZG84_03705 [Salinivibrio sp. PR932]